jgi:LPXTG-site transpeptidase (sortase) family protein
VPPEPDPASLDAASRAVLIGDDLWQGAPPEPRPAWADEGVAAWDDWSRQAVKSRPVVMPVVVMAAVVAAVSAALTAAPGPVIGTPTAGAHPAPPARTAIIPAAPPSAMPAPTSTKAPPPRTTTPKPQPPPPPPPRRKQAPGTVRLAQGGTATLVRKDVVDGVLPIPEGVREATWWGAPFDGATGATVLAGHVNWKGATGPFAELWEARLGDVVTVVEAGGATHRYKVRQLVTVHKDQLPSRAQELFGQEGPHRLVLVTCGGRWVGGRDGYEENRVVIAQPI